MSPLVEGRDTPLLCPPPAHRVAARDEGPAGDDERANGQMSGSGNAHSGKGLALDGGASVRAVFITIARKV